TLHGSGQRPVDRDWRRRRCAPRRRCAGGDRRGSRRRGGRDRAGAIDLDVEGFTITLDAVFAGLWGRRRLLFGGLAGLDLLFTTLAAEVAQRRHREEDETEEVVRRLGLHAGLP